MDVFYTALRTLRVTGTAIVIAFAAGVPLGAWLGLHRFRGSRAAAVVVNTGMGTPPTAAGLLVAWLVSRHGPFQLDLGCSIPAMVAAQVVIAAPIVAGLTMAALLAFPADVRLQAEALGARGVRLAVLLLREARVGVLAAAIAAYGGIVSEVGAALMTGCNLSGTGGNTRLLTTAAVEEVRKGDYGTAAWLSLVLLGIVLAINAVLTWAQHRQPGQTRWVAVSRRGRG